MQGDAPIRRAIPHLDRAWQIWFGETAKLRPQWLNCPDISLTCQQQAPPLSCANGPLRGHNQHSPIAPGDIRFMPLSITPRPGKYSAIVFWLETPVQLPFCVISKTRRLPFLFIASLSTYTHISDHILGRFSFPLICRLFSPYSQLTRLPYHRCIAAEGRRITLPGTTARKMSPRNFPNHSRTPLVKDIVGQRLRQVALPLLARRPPRVQPWTTPMMAMVPLQRSSLP